MILLKEPPNREDSPYLACNDRNAFFIRKKVKKTHAWSCQNVFDALTFLLDNIFMRFGTKLYRQVVWIPMDTYCAPLVADLFLFCHERDFMMSFLDLHLFISNDIVSTKIYDQRDDFDFEIVNCPFLDGDVTRSTSYGVYISQLIRFARASSDVAQKLLKQGYKHHKLGKTFSKFYRRYYTELLKKPDTFYLLQTRK